MDITPACLHAVMKMIYNFPEKSELPTLLVKISQLIIFCSFRFRNEKFAEIRASSLSRFCICGYAVDFCAPM